MKCPVCGVELMMTNRQGVEIDYCPQCRGVWLDRGELDKIIERSASLPSERDFDDRSPEHREERRGDHSARKKRKGFLGDLFDFD